MGRRNDIDWERIQKLYLAGQLTVAEICEECGVHQSAVTRKAKKEGWVRNLAEAIKERAKAKIAHIDVGALIEQSATESAKQSAETIKQAIEEAANISANIRLRQRAEVKQETERVEYLNEVLNSHLPSLENVGDVLKATQAYKNLMDVKMKLQDREDKIFGLDEESGGDDGEDTVIIVNGVKVE